MADTDLTRISRIGDSVFAVTITLLAYRVHIPDQHALESMRLEPLLPFLQDLGAVVLSFFVASRFYLAHWRVFRRLRNADVTFVALNLLFLGTLVLLPISTSLVSGNLTSVGTVAYSGNLLLTSASHFFLRRHARRMEPDAFGEGRLLVASTFSMSVLALAVLVSFRWPEAALPLWLISLGSAWIDRRWGIGA